MTGEALQFGIFDQNDHGRYPLTEQYDKRLALIEAYDRAGFRTYHMSEHHSTPLNLTPSPSVFLAAVAQRTRRLRFGALVYVLPAHHPLRLAEEICMLDHLSRGRLEIGIRRGSGDVCRSLSSHHAVADASGGEFRRQALSIHEGADRPEAGTIAASAIV